MDNGWNAGGFAVRTDKGEREVAGWLKGPFAVDFRAIIDANDEVGPGWAITHVGSGCIVRQVACGLSDALAIADMILDIADWSFTDANDAKPLESEVMKVKARLADHVDVTHHMTIPPFSIYNRPTFAEEHLA